MISVFLKSTVFHLESVNLPSSSTWSRILKISGCAFSTSSKRITAYGFLLTASVSCPPSSYPIYHAGAPINFATLCFSIYSDISILINAFSSSKRADAKAFVSSVFQTQVGHKNKNEPIGLFGSFSPALALRIALETKCNA
jgi:hypothetical protein